MEDSCKCVNTSKLIPDKTCSCEDHCVIDTPFCEDNENKPDDITEGISDTSNNLFFKMIYEIIIGFWEKYHNSIAICCCRFLGRCMFSLFISIIFCVSVLALALLLLFTMPSCDDPHSTFFPLCMNATIPIRLRLVDEMDNTIYHRYN